MAQSTVKLIVDAQNAISPLKRVNDATKNLSRNTDKLKDKLNEGKKNFDKFGNAGKGASSKVNTLTGTIKKLAAAFALIKTAQFIFVNAADIETQRKSLEVLTGSLSKTNQIIKELQDFGAVTPFKSSELIEQTKRLKAFGFETDELVDTTKRLADVAGATGADLQGIATAFGQIRAKGKLQQEENLQLLERGVDITTELKNITGLQGEAFEKAQRQGKIGADLVNQALINLTNEGGAFFEGASAQATTLNGKLSTLVDSVESLARTIGSQLSPAIKGALDLATKGVVAIERIFSRLGDVGDIGLGNVAKAEQDARRDAARLTATRFGTQFKGESVFASKEENKFFREQFELLKKQNIEREKLRKKSFEEVTIIEEGNKKQTEKTKKIIETNNAANVVNETLNESNSILTEAIDQTDELKQKMTAVGEEIEGSIKNNLRDSITGAQTFGQAMTNVLNRVRNKIIDAQLDKLLGNFGESFAVKQNKGGGFGGFLGNLTGSLLGGFFANGGQPPVNRISVVGEKGPELFVPRSAGTIIPNNKLGGGITNNYVTVNVEGGGVAASGNNVDLNALGQVIGLVVQAQLVKEKQAGGILAR